MSIWVLIALASYCLGVFCYWFDEQAKYQELDEYTNFPIIWATKLVLVSGCFLEALLWPVSLILGDSISLERQLD
ncbi:MAG: hypothetical protein H0X31_03260 [Nostocaceae cyanobacterium]|nr:hypothetical protein [Nostocaceae cyanobacterium]